LLFTDPEGQHIADPDNRVENIADQDPEKKNIADPGSDKKKTTLWIRIHREKMLRIKIQRGKSIADSDPGEKTDYGSRFFPLINTNHYSNQKRGDFLEITTQSPLPL